MKILVQGVMINGSISGPNMRMWPTEGTAFYSSDSSLALDFKMLENFEDFI